MWLDKAWETVLVYINAIPNATLRVLGKGGLQRIVIIQEKRRRMMKTRDYGNGRKDRH